MKTVSRLYILGLSVLTASAFQNCAPVNITPIESIEYSTGYGDVCTESFTEATVPVKILFLVDVSGSNKADKKTPGTDPTKSWRLSAQEQFLAAYPDKTNFSYNITTFSGKSAKSLMTPSYSNDISSGGAVLSAIDDFKSIVDSDSTPYRTALAKVKDIIATDLRSAAADTKYVIVMLTDGEPTDYNIDSDVAVIQSDIGKIINLAPESISLNTVYYNNYQFTAKAESLLTTMSVAGRGTFVKADTSRPKIEIKDTIRVPSSNCP